MTSAAPARADYRSTFAVLSTAVMAYALLQSLVIPVLPTIQAELHTSQNTVTWVLTAYLLSASIFTPIVGRLGDMWGKERMLVAALAVLAAGCVMSALATSVAVMVLGRVIQGVGGGVVPLAFGIVRDEFPKEKVPGAVGAIASLAAAGAGLGIVLAGPIVSALNSHWLFWVPAIMLVIAGVAAKLVVPASPSRVPGRVNWLAAILLSVWLVALLLPVSEAPVWGWGSPRVIGLIAVAVVVAAIWIMVESRSANPLVDMAMMRLRVVWTSNLVAFLFGVGMYAVFAFVPEFVQTAPSAGYGFGVGVTHAGVLILPLSVAMFILGASTGRLTSQFGGKAVLLVGTVISIVPFVMLATVNSQQWEIAVAMGVLGGGFGLAFAAMSNLIVEGVPIEQTGVASGMNANIRTMGGSLGAALMSSIVTASAHGGSLPAKAGYVHGFEMLALSAVIGGVAAALVPSKLRHVTKAEFSEALPHAELGLVAAGTLLGDDPE